jgi:anti-sigma regulatory factor (Ser/Thr protein kinase)
MTASVTQPRAELTIHADTWDARHASVWLESAALAQGVPREQIVRLDHCLDEALANVIAHAGPTALASPVRLQFGMRRSQGTCAAELSVADAGVAFDPSHSPPGATPRPASLAEARPGGLGLLMMRKFSDGLSYRRSEGSNHLTITVSWTETA